MDWLKNNWKWIVMVIVVLSLIGALTWSLTRPPKIIEKPVEKVVVETVVVEKIVKETVVVEAVTPTPTPIPPTPTPVPPKTRTGCRNLVWWEEALDDTDDIASLISLLDRDFKAEEGGQWSEAGFTVPNQSVFWTDLLENVTSLPIGVSTIRVQGGWGVYFASAEYTVPAPNGGGRWMALCATPSNTD